MDNQKKIVLLEETFDVKKGTLKEDTILSSLKRWDSMTKLSLVILMDDEFGKTLKADRIKKFVTVKDIIDYMA